MPSYREVKVGALAGREPVFARADETLRSVARTMWLENVGALVVGDAQRPLGIISERDLVSQIGRGEDLDAVTADQIMTSFLIAARAGDTADDAAYQMLESGIRHLPVTDGEGRVVGMISVRDLLRPLLLDGSEGPESARDQ